MQQNIFSLRWKYFHTNISSSLSDLYTETSYTDVTLVSDDQIQFHAHKFILSACSPVMKNLLLSNPHSHPLIYLRGIKQQELGSILQFLYHGEALIHENRANILFENAKVLQIKHLVNSLVTGSNVDNREDDHANIEKGAEIDEIGIIPSLDICDVVEYEYDTQSISSHIDESLSLDIPVYKPGMTRSDCGNQLHKCGECGKGFRWKTALLVHIRSKHEGIKYYLCNQCEYQSTGQGDLNKHKQSHQVYQVTQRAHLKVHQQSTTKGDIYSCNQCEYQATEKEHIKTHKDSFHEADKYPCNQCEYLATTNGNLKTHKQSLHDGVKYSCNQCEYLATWQGSLKTHKQSIHDGVKYSCKQCDYQATQRSSLKKHNQVKHSKLK